ncbi:hypothetical protein EYF80_036640 [Liparis tanakae]|uniref:Uncharacterized protein n=1 Tax=Liparis tanakae TaxID=230148 RepID=A0A4Z2GIH5_9TELE|nr:hypothetical protein EYF80_036640 [Liparis tanakae]
MNGNQWLGELRGHSLIAPSAVALSADQPQTITCNGEPERRVVGGPAGGDTRRGGGGGGEQREGRTGKKSRREERRREKERGVSKVKRMEHEK